MAIPAPRPLLFSLTILSLISSLLLPSLAQQVGPGIQPGVPVFERDVLPILQAKCVNCHGDQKRKADLDMRSKAAMLQGGESGPSFKPGTLKDSPLWDKIATDKMPPGKDKLSAAEKEIIKRWIESGAHALSKTPLPDVAESEVSDADRDFWSFRKPVRPAIPKELVSHPIDAFILAELRKKGLLLSPQADHATLLRRVNLDLTGLPPTPKEISEFLADQSVDAYEKVVDRLLASPHYGERWGRHWLDLAGYADSEGIFDGDSQRAAAWRYRDYVIAALNSDKPYDRFLQEQLAGDELIDYWTVRETQKELPPHVVEALVATGFLRTARDVYPATTKNKESYRFHYQTLDDTVRIVASSTLGLTIHCAKCHSHKLEPIPQADYYRLQAIFMSGFRPFQWVTGTERRIMDVDLKPAERKEANKKIEAALATLKKQQGELQKVFADKLYEKRLFELPKNIREDVRTAMQLANPKRNEEQKKLAQKYQAELRPTGANLENALRKEFPDYGSELDKLTQQMTSQQQQRQHLEKEIRAFYDLPGEAKTPILRRGDLWSPGREVQPAPPAVLVTSQPFKWSPPATEEEAKRKTSGRRLAFARWLTQSDHPLTARVLVNRLWFHYFGQGIVSTTDNFGRSGSAPSHPELLDWLASEFTSPTLAPKATAWSLKRMHRLIVTSATYRQSSKIDPVKHLHAIKSDPDNRLLWRQRPRRLEAEALRDAILSVAGNLNPEMFGPPVKVKRNDATREVVAPLDATGSRRSIYLQVLRLSPLTFLQLYDHPDLETNCTRREISTVVTQALMMLNSDFMVKQGETFADRVLKETEDNPAAAAGHALLLAFGRAATENELGKLNAFLRSQTAAYAQIAATNDNNEPAAARQTESRRRAMADLCQMLLCTNEFAYVD